MSVMCGVLKTQYWGQYCFVYVTYLAVIFTNYKQHVYAQDLQIYAHFNINNAWVPRIDDDINNRIMTYPPIQ